MFDKCIVEEQAGKFWEQGNQALLREKWGAALRQYKRATFLCPSDARFWVGLGRAYSGKQEYHNAKEAFEQGLGCFPYSPAAEEGRRECLQQLNLPEETLSLAEAIRQMDFVAQRLLKESRLLVMPQQLESEKEIWHQEEFTKKVYDWCYQRCGPLEREKLCRQTIGKTFFASLCVTLLYYQLPDGIDKEDPFAEMEKNHDMEDAENWACRLAEWQTGDVRSMEEKIRNYSEFCWQIVRRVSPESDRAAAVLDAGESAYMLGMLTAAHCWKKKMTPPRLQ